jgi:type III secretory pathway component EscV
MENNDLDEYAYLWDRSKNEHFRLVEIQDEVAKSIRYAIYDTATRTFLVIENDEVYTQVIERMKLAGTKKIRSIVTDT